MQITNLNYRLRRMFYKTEIQLDVDYVCTAWYPLIIINNKNKFPNASNKRIEFCLDLEPKFIIYKLELKKTN